VTTKTVKNGNKKVKNDIKTKKMAY